MGNETINRLFEAQAARTPENTALIYENLSITYAELNRKANQRAHYLIARGVLKEDFVGIVMDHSIDMIIDIFAVLKSGAAYVPIEAMFPRARINYIVSRTGLKCVFTQKKYRDIFDEQDILIYEDEDFTRYPVTNPPHINNAGDTIYVLFTSGTTGEPKGVVVEHHNVCNYVEAFKKEFGITEKDRMLQNSVCTFDIFVEELFPILLTGGALVIADADEKSSVEKLADLMERERITVLTGFPYLLSDFNHYRIPHSLKLAISGGDILRREHADNLLRKVKVYNTYGPTETTVCVAYYQCGADALDAGTIPIGKPVYGAQIYLLDENLKPVKPGEVGEICIAGNGVARGYFHNAQETQKHFIDNPYGEGRMYKSGDLGVVRADGNIEFIKRKDRQIMIMGKRVEPAEVENVMAGYGGLEAVVVKAYQDERGYPYLVGYLCSRRKIELSALKKYLQNYLPDFMIPEFFMQLASMPQTPNGKIDRGHLPVVLK